MRPWQIIIASAVVASIVVAGVFLPGLLPLSRGGVTSFLGANWPAMTVVWLGIYGLAALGQTVAAIFLAIGPARRRVAATARSGTAGALPIAAFPSTQSYLVWLAATQYFTAVIALLGLALLGVPVEPVTWSFVSAAVANAPALSACGAVALAGVLGTLAVIAALVPFERELSRLRPDSPELRLLRQIVDMLRTRPPVPAVPAAADAPQLIALIEQGQRSVLEGISGLATAVNRLSRSLRQILGEIEYALHEGGPEQPVVAAAEFPAAMEGTTADLQSVVTALTAAVGNLGEIASLLATDRTAAAWRRDAPMPDNSLAQLSIELDELLREINESPSGKPDDSPA